MMTAVKFKLNIIIEEDVAVALTWLDQLNMSLEQLVIPNIDKWPDQGADEQL